ncbi:MAG: ABC transporter ATP-binding protein, partial [Pseudomonadota bacterium]
EDIRDIQQNLGLTVVYVTHDQEEALAVSDRIIVMRNAAIAQEGTPRELFEAPADTFVADFIGEANLIPCEIDTVDGDTAHIRIGDHSHSLPARGLGPGPATVAVRPERVQLVEASEPGLVSARIAKATYVGSHMEYTVDTPVGTLFATSPDVERPFNVGQDLALSFAGSGPVLLPSQ